MVAGCHHDHCDGAALCQMASTAGIAGDGHSGAKMVLSARGPIALGVCSTPVYSRVGDRLALAMARRVHQRQLSGERHVLAQIAQVLFDSAGQ